MDKKAFPRAHDVVLSRRCNPGETAPVEPGAVFALGQNLCCYVPMAPLFTLRFSGGWSVDRTGGIRFGSS